LEGLTFSFILHHFQAQFVDILSLYRYNTLRSAPADNAGAKSCIPIPNFPVRRHADIAGQIVFCPTCGWYGEVKLGGSLMKYAIVEDGGKQFKAVEGSTIEVDYFEAEAGEQVDLERVLMVVDDEAIHIGTPLVDGAKVEATVVAQVKGPKVVVFRYKPKKRIRVKTGHRQKYTRLQIETISLKV